MTQDLAAQRLEAGAAAFSARDISALLDTWDPDIVWQVAGRSPLSGTFRGRDELARWFAAIWEKTGGTARTDMEKVLVSGDYAVHFIRMSGERDGEPFSFLIAAFTEGGPDGRARRLWCLPDDQAALERAFA